MSPLLTELRFDITGTEASSTLLDFSRLLYHLDLSYEIARLATDPKYRGFEFPAHTFRRVISPLDHADQLQLRRIRHESPWQLSISIQDLIAALGGGLGAFWLFLQCLDKLTMYRLNRIKVKAEIAKLLLETERVKRELGVSEEQPKRLSDASSAPVSVEGPSRLEKAATRVLQERDDNSVLVPPIESVRAYNRLVGRNAQDLYEGNTRVLQRLGYEISEMDIRISARDTE